MITFRLNRSLAFAAVVGAGFLAGPLHAAQTAAAGTADMKNETVEQRITSLHTALKITPDEESKWNDVAQAMRENAAAMEKLHADSTKQAPQSMTALDDLTAYEKFAQAHVDGLKNLIASFKTLYNAMPDAQKKVADSVFDNFGQHGAQAHG